MRPSRAIKRTFNVWPAFTDLLAGFLILLVFVFIVGNILNSLQMMKLKRLQALVGSVQKDLKELKEVMQGEDGSVEVDGGNIIIQSDILFPFSKWSENQMRSTAVDSLERIGLVLKTYLEGRKNRDLFSIVIEGHTDMIGSAEDNEILSYKRARTIAQIWRRVGLTPERFELVPAGLGESRPVVRLSSEQTIDFEERKIREAKNRRVEIKIIPKFSEMLKKYVEQN